MSRLDGGILGLEGPGEVWHIVVSKGWGALGSCSIPLSREVGIGCSTSHAKKEGKRKRRRSRRKRKTRRNLRPAEEVQVSSQG